MNIAKTTMAMAMLTICPISRMVATVPEAIPRCLLSTELIIAFIFGDENRANPMPRKARIKTIIIFDVSGPIKTKNISPRTVTDIPADAIKRGSILSDSRPASGEKTAIIMGWAMRIDPAYWGGMPLIYCR
jgi:hypothetical protein